MNDLSVYAHDIVSLVTMNEAMELYGFSVSSTGFCLCPFHNEKTPSVKVYKDHFHCFGCGASGDVISLARKLFDLSFEDALKRLNSDFSLNLHIGERITLRQSNEYKRRKRQIEQARRRERERRERVREEYYTLLDEHIRLERNFKLYRPKKGDEETHPLFAEACMKLGFVANLLDTFDWEGGSAA